MIRTFLNLFSKNDSLDYILQPTAGISPQELASQAKKIEAISSEIAETVWRIIDVVHGKLPEDKNEAAQRVLITMSSELGVLIRTIDDFLTEVAANPELPIGTMYQIQSGDTLSAIAEKFGTTVSELVELNSIEDPNLIFPGQLLLIPGKMPSEPQPEPEPQPAKSWRPGIWGINGQGINKELISRMHSWKPTAITCFDEHLEANGVFDYKLRNPDTKIIIRFQHHKNWQQNPGASAKDLAQRVISKWDNIKGLDPYVYYFNEGNLHYENGNPNAGDQHLYQTPQFYQQYAAYITDVAKQVKGAVPELRLVCPPFAYGHDEDGQPDDDGFPKIGWAGYDWLIETIKNYFDNIICMHYYWGHGGGRVADWLLHPEESSWHAFRWRRLLKMLKVRWSLDAKLIIDECGAFQAGHPEFLSDVEFYSRECLSDPRVIALTWFLWHDPTHENGKKPNGNMANDWWFNMTDKQLAQMVEKLRVIE